MAKVKINSLPPGLTIKNGKIVSMMQQGGMTTGDQFDFGLVTNVKDPNKKNQTKDINVRHTLNAVPRTQANIEAEGGETVLTDLDNDGLFGLYDIKGPRHSSGGVPLNLPEQSFVFSDTKDMKLGGSDLKAFGINSRKKMTPATISKKYDLNTYYGSIKDEYADDIQVKSAELMMDKNKKALSKLAFVQESKKDFEEGVPVTAYPYLASQGIDPIDFTAKVERISQEKAQQKAIASLPPEQQQKLMMLQQIMQQAQASEQQMAQQPSPEEMEMGRYGKELRKAQVGKELDSKEKERLEAAAKDPENAYMLDLIPRASTYIPGLSLEAMRIYEYENKKREFDLLKNDPIMNSRSYPRSGGISARNLTEYVAPDYADRNNECINPEDPSCRISNTFLKQQQKLADESDKLKQSFIPQPDNRFNEILTNPKSSSTKYLEPINIQSKAINTDIFGSPMVDPMAEVNPIDITGKTLINATPNIINNDITQNPYERITLNSKSPSFDVVSNTTFNPNIETFLNGDITYPYASNSYTFDQGLNSGSAPEAFDPNVYNAANQTNQQQTNQAQLSNTGSGDPKKKEDPNKKNVAVDQSRVNRYTSLGIQMDFGNVGETKYVDVQPAETEQGRKDQVGRYGDASANEKGWVQSWAGIYPETDALINSLATYKKGKKETVYKNPEVVKFQTWLNNTYIPQSVANINAELKANGYDELTPQQITDLTTDLRTDFGFGAGTGRDFDGKYGTFTSSRRPLNYKIKPKEQPKTGCPCEDGTFSESCCPGTKKIPPATLKPPAKRPDAEWWLQDLIQLNAIANRERDMFFPFQPAVANVDLGYVLEEPTRAIAATNERLGIQTTAAGAFGGPQALAARTAQAQGQAAAEIANEVARVNQRNVSTINQGLAQQAQMDMLLGRERRDRVVKEYDDTQAVLQKYMDEKNYDREQYAMTLSNAITNRANTYNLNSIQDYYQIDPTTGGMIGQFSSKAFEPVALPDPNKNINEYADIARKLKASGIEPTAELIQGILGQQVTPTSQETNAQRAFRAMPPGFGYSYAPGMYQQPKAQKGKEVKKAVVPFFIGKIGG